MSDELSDEDLERQMRRKLLFSGPSSRASANALSPDQQRIADKLLEGREAGRPQRQQPPLPRRPKRARPPVVVAEYYEVPPMDSSWGSFFGGGWTVDVRVDGRMHKSRTGLSREDCLQLVAKLEKRGLIAKPVITEWMKHQTPPSYQAPPTTCRRKSFDDRFGGFEP